MRVVFCTDGVFPLQVGGMQRHSKLLPEALAETKEVALTVIHPHVGETLFDSKYNITEIAVTPINAEKNYLKESYAYSKRVYAEVMKLPEDTIVYNQGFAIWYKAGTLTKRLITNPHGLEPFQAISRKDKLVAIPFKRIFKKIFRQSSYTVALGGKLTTILQEILPKNQIAVLPNAVNTVEGVSLRSKPDSKEPIQLCFVARFAQNKGIHILMQAIEELNAEGYQEAITYRLAGKGPLYEEYIAKYKMENVSFLGFVSDAELEEMYRSSDAFCFPTLFEGMPTVVLEAMRYYLPVIVSDTGATCELVDEKNGYLLEPENVQQLKTSILEFWQLSAAEKNKMSEVSFHRVKSNFTWEAVAQKHLNLFQTIASK